MEGGTEGGDVGLLKSDPHFLIRDKWEGANHIGPLITERWHFDVKILVAKGVMAAGFHCVCFCAMCSGDFGCSRAADMYASIERSAGRSVGRGAILPILRSALASSSLSFSE